MRKRKRKAERRPWYRARNYKGNLTEAEKRQLDAFRVQPKHPATRYHDLPEEVQRYINRIEMEVYDRKQDKAAVRALLGSAIGAALLYLTYEGCLGARTGWKYAIPALLLVMSWIGYWYEWQKNSEEFMPSDDDAWAPTDEGLREEWELEYISRSREAERRASASR